MTVEGIARVVRIDGDVAWFEPEQTTSCGHCASSAACGAGSAATGTGNGIGSIARRIEFRRFPLADSHGLQVGERVVVGVAERSLVKASAIAYALPLATALLAGGAGQAWLGGDLGAMAGMAAGLAAGLLAARLLARGMSRRGELSPRFLRRAGSPPPKSPCGDLPPGGPETLGTAQRVSAGETCHTA
jgi:sigma-E factor negative regulatory protein RseC